MLVPLAAGLVTLAVWGLSHVTAGLPPVLRAMTPAQGVYVGLGHPLSELDHMAMLLGGGAVAAMVGRGHELTLAFVAATLVGMRLPGLGLGMPHLDLVLGLSVLGCGLALAAMRADARWVLAPCFVAAGLAHGFDYGASLVAAPPAEFLAALLAVVCLQLGVMTAAYRVGGLYPAQRAATKLTMQRAGAYLLLAGLVCVVLAKPG